MFPFLIEKIAVQTAPISRAANKRKNMVLTMGGSFIRVQQQHQLEQASLCGSSVLLVVPIAFSTTLLFCKVMGGYSKKVYYLLTTLTNVMIDINRLNKN